MERIHEELYKGDLNELDYYNDVVSHLEPDMLEREVKWALGSTAVNKASGCDGIPIELFRTERMMPSRCCIQYVSKSERPSSGHRTGRGQSSSQFPRRVVLKNVLTIGQLQSSPILVRLCLKSCVLSFSNMRTKNFQMSKLALENVEEPEVKFPTFPGSQRKLGILEKYVPLFH